MRIKIEVTKQDIRDGTQRSAYSCAIAMALNRSGMDLPFVSACEIVYLEGGVRRVAKPTKKLVQFIKDFDRSKDRVKPTSFVVKVLDQA